MTANLNSDEGGRIASNLKENIPTATIQELVDNFRNNQLSCINKNMEIDDAHSIWFDLVTLKNFIAEIENEATIVDPTVTTEDLGIRFYYAAYPEVPVSPTPEDYAKRHTLIMIPTKKEENESGEKLNYDFNPYLGMNINGEENQALAITAGLSRNAMAQNHGRLIPPGSSIVESY